MHSFYCNIFFLGGRGVFSEQAYLKAMIVVFSKVLSVIFNYKSSVLEGFVVRKQLRAHMTISHFFLSLLTFFSLSCQLPWSHPNCLSFRSVKQISKQNLVYAETLTSLHACKKCIFFHHPFPLM